MLNWELYALSRLAAPLMVMCLSLVTVLWSDFIGVDEVRAVSFGNLFPSRISLHGAPRRIRSGDCLRIGLAATNCFALLVSLLFEVAVLFEPSVIWYGTKGDPNSNSWPIQLGWLCYESTRFALVVLMIYYGYQVQQRIGATGVFTSPEDEKKQKNVIWRLLLSLATISVFVAIGIVTRVIISLPLFWDDDDQLPQIYTYVNVRMSIMTFEVLVQILPFDAVSFILLFLMRQPPKKRWGLDSSYR